MSEQRNGKTKSTSWIIAGPNGAGKTTFALEYLPQVAGCTHFINADLIAAGLSPLAPDRELLVAHGGHNILAADIERRFPRSLSHLLNDFSHRVDRCTCFMNDGESSALVFEQRGSERDIVHDDYYQLLLEEVKR
jgi:predicted ABC-type ATPase